MLMNSKELWKERFRYFLKEIRTYGKYVFNDHLKFIFVFIIGAGAYYYQQWLQTLTPSFPAAVVMAVLFGLVLTAGSVQTLLKEADTTSRRKIKNIFRKSISIYVYNPAIYCSNGKCSACAALFPADETIRTNIHNHCNCDCAK